MYWLTLVMFIKIRFKEFFISIKKNWDNIVIIIFMTFVCACYWYSGYKFVQHFGTDSESFEQIFGGFVIGFVFIGCTGILLQIFIRLYEPMVNLKKWINEKIKKFKYWLNGEWLNAGRLARDRKKINSLMKRRNNV